MVKFLNMVRNAAMRLIIDMRVMFVFEEEIFLMRSIFLKKYFIIEFNGF